MPENSDLDVRLREKELEKLDSEILRNRAEYDRLQHNGWRVLATVVTGFLAGLALLATFQGFFSDLRSIAVVDREDRDRRIRELTTRTEDLTKTNRGLEDKLRISGDAESRLAGAVATALSRDQALDQIRSLVTGAEAASDPSRVLSQVRARVAGAGPSSPGALSEKELEGRVLVVWWSGSALDALVVGLFGLGTPAASERFAEGVSLSSATDRGSQEWVGRWRIANGRVTLQETWPNARAGASIEVDLTREVSEGRWLVLRTADGVSTRGVGQLLQAGALPERR